MMIGINQAGIVGIESFLYTRQNAGTMPRNHEGDSRLPNQQILTFFDSVCPCRPYCRARGVTEGDLSHWGAKFSSPTIFVSLVEWADRVITE
jgi:hypothetical protein